MKNLAIFASGNGSNAENIIRYFKDDKEISIKLVLTNNAEAPVIKRAENLNVHSVIFSREEFYSTAKVVNALNRNSIDFVILAGFMWLVPMDLIKQYSNKIINIHPALLPKYGGKGMYGDFVHKAVSSARETSTGITIHYVNEKYDEGAVIFQKAIEILPGESPDIIAEKIHALEYEYFPQVIENVLSGRLK